jgi:hypothetical protein
LITKLEPTLTVPATTMSPLARRYDGRHTVEIRLDRTFGNPDPSPPVEMIFSDASGGNFWHRDRYGGLTQITTGLPPSGATVFFRDPANTL